MPSHPVIQKFACPPSFFKYYETIIDRKAGVSICGIGPGFTNLIIPQEINGKPVIQIAQNAFSYSDISRIELPENLLYIEESAFAKCRELKAVVFPSTLLEIKDEAFSDCYCLQDVVFREGITEIGSRAFFDCNIKTLKLPDSLITINNRAFQSNPISDVCFGSNLEWLGNNAFDSCCLEKVVLPDSLINLGYEAFDDCECLKSVHIGAKLEICGIAGRGFCVGCDELAKITVSPKNEYFKVIDNVLYDYRNKTLMRFPPNLEKGDIVIPSWVKSIADYAFSGCWSLESVKFKSKDIENIESSSLEEIDDLVIHCDPDSRIKVWAQDNDIKVGISMSKMEKFFLEDENSVPETQSANDADISL